MKGILLAGDDPATLILVDNLFFGTRLAQRLQAVVQRRDGPTIFAHYVRMDLAHPLRHNAYGRYLLRLARGEGARGSS